MTVDREPKILIVANDYIGGVREHIRSEVRYLRRHNCEFYIICNTGSATFATDGFRAGIGDYHVTPFPGISTVETEIEQIANFIEKHGIDILHCHAYDLLPYAVAAAARTKTRIVNTVHGPDIWACAGNHAAGSIFQRFLARIPMHFAVSNNLATQLRHLIPGIDVSVLNNPIEIIYRIGQPGQVRRWAWAGRLSPDKVEGLKPLITALRDIGAQSIDIYGSGSAEAHLGKFIDTTWPESARMCGWREDVSKLFAGYDAVCGMGRVALDSMALGIPTVLVGYDGVRGFVTHENVEAFSTDNFSGRNAQCVGIEEFRNQVAKYPDNKSSLDLVEWTGARHDAEKVWRQFLKDLNRATPPTASGRHLAIELSHLAWICQRIIRRLKFRTGSTSPA